MSGFYLFALMIVGHCLADYPLQGDFLAKAKNHRAPIPGAPWQQALAAHSIIQGGVVGLLTGSIVIGCCEALAHATIDFLKSEGEISFNTDQALHIICKMCWLGLYLLGQIGGRPLP